MNTLFGEAFDLYRFRVKPLSSYRFPLWKLVLFLAAIGLASSASSPELGRFLPGRIGFCIAYNLLETAIFTLFIGVWLRLELLHNARQIASLVVLSSAVQFLLPLADWLPDDVGSTVVMAAMFYSLIVLCNALIRVSGMRRLRVICGVLAFSFLSAFLMQGSWSLASRWHLVDPPASWWNPFAGENLTGGDGSSSSDTGGSSDDSSDNDSGDSGSDSDSAPAFMP
jgi:hypothetical protein